MRLNTNQMAYVYTHYTEDENKLFYVGISSKEDQSRATDKTKRSRFWKSIVAKHGFRAEIIQDNITWEEAIQAEIDFIAQHGRLFDGSGVLCNLTIGGEGCTGFPITEEYRRKCSESQKGRPGKSGEENNFYGRKHTKESMAKRLETLERNGTLRRGENHPHFRKPMHPSSKAGLDKFRASHKKHTEEHKAKISAGGKGIKKTEEWKEKRRGAGNVNYVGFSSIEELTDLYVNKKLSTVKIAALFNVSHATVGCRLKQAGIKLKRQNYG